MTRRTRRHRLPASRSFGHHPVPDDPGRPVGEHDPGRVDAPPAAAVEPGVSAGGRGRCGDRRVDGHYPLPRQARRPPSHRVELVHHVNGCRVDPSCKSHLLPDGNHPTDRRSGRSSSPCAGVASAAAAAARRSERSRRAPRPLTPGATSTSRSRAARPPGPRSSLRPSRCPIVEPQDVGVDILSVSDER